MHAASRRGQLCSGPGEPGRWLPPGFRLGLGVRLHATSTFSLPGHSWFNPISGTTDNGSATGGSFWSLLTDRFLSWPVSLC